MNCRALLCRLCSNWVPLPNANARWPTLPLLFWSISVIGRPVFWQFFGRCCVRRALLVHIHFSRAVDHYTSIYKCCFHIAQGAGRAKSGRFAYLRFESAISASLVESNVLNNTIGLVRCGKMIDCGCQGFLSMD